MTNIRINCPKCDCERDVSKVVISSDGMEFTCAFCDHKQSQNLIKNQILGYIKELANTEKILLDKAKNDNGKISNDDFYILLETKDLLKRLRKLVPK